MFRHRQISRRLLKKVDGAGPYRSSDMITFVNETEQELCLFTDFQLLLYVAPHDRELIHKDIISSNQVKVSIAGTGMSAFIKVLRPQDITSKREFNFTEADLSMQRRVEQLIMLQTKFKAYLATKRASAAQIIQAAVRGKLQRMQVVCMLCCNTHMRASSIPVRHHWTKATSTSTNNRTPTNVFSLECTFEEFSPWPQDSRALNREGKWVEHVCFNCFNVHLHEMVVKKQEVKVPCFKSCGAIIPPEVIEQFASHEIAEAYRKILERRDLGASKLQALYRGMVARKQAYCPVCMDQTKAAFMFRFNHSDLPCEACRVCVKRMLDVAITDGKLFVKCFGADCTRTLRVDELSTVAGQESLVRLLHKRNENHQSYVQELNNGNADPSFIAWCGVNTRICSFCSVLIYRYAGCDSMVCSCGSDFMWPTAKTIDVDHAAQVKGSDMLTATKINRKWGIRRRISQGLRRPSLRFGKWK